MENITQHWDRKNLGEQILNRLAEIHGTTDGLNIDDFAPFDQFHGGGKEKTVKLARIVGVTSGMKVLDVGGGLGGPARTLAVEFDCIVTVVDPAPSYIEAGRSFTRRLELTNRITHIEGDALNLPSSLGEFDVVWTQNSGMNIADKQQLYQGFKQRLRPGGLLAIQEPVAGPVAPPIFPLMWANEPSSNFLLTANELLDVIKSAGFSARDWEVLTPASRSASSYNINDTIQNIVMGEVLESITKAQQRNREEGRIQAVQAVFEALQ